MPLQHDQDGVPVVRLDPALEISPFELLERLRDEDDSPLLIDLRELPHGWTLRGAVHQPVEAIQPAPDRDTVLYDQDGRTGPELVRQLRAEGEMRVWALFGGLDLYTFCLDPGVVEADTFLDPVAP